LIVTDPSNLARISSAIEPSEVRSPAARAIYGRCLARYRAGAAADFDRLMLEAEEPWAKNLLVSLLEQSRVKEEADQDRRLEEVLRSFQRRKEDTEHHHAVAALREEANPDSEALLAEALAALRSRHQRPKLTDG